MPDPITTAIATAVAGSAANSLAAEATRVLGQITARIREKLGARSRDNAVPANSGDGNDPRDNSASLAALLHQAFQQDPGFATELTALWRDYQNAAAGTVSNSFHGTANKVVQMGNVQGDLNIS